MALTPSDLRRRKMNLLMAMSYAAFASSKASAWSPTLLFAAGEQGAWYDPSDFSTMFQDSAGTTPVTAVEQPVGLLLDKRGSSISYNPATMTISSYDGGGATTIVRAGANLTFTSAASGDGIRFNAITVADNYAVIEFIASGSGSLLVYAGAAPLAVTLTGTPTAYRTATHPNTAAFTIFRSNSAGLSASITINSVYAIRGNHASQSTAASRPVLSARVNQLTFSEQFDNAVWVRFGLTTTGMANTAVAPNGTTTADSLINDGTNTFHGLRNASFAASSSPWTYSAYFKAGTLANVSIAMTSGNPYTNDGAVATFDLSAGTVSKTDGPAYVSSSITSVGNGWYKCSVTASNAAINLGWIWLNSTNNPTYAGFGYETFAGTSGQYVYAWGADLRVTNVGVNLPAYQRVAAATDYDTNGFPLYLRSDGVDDRLIGPAISNLVSASAYEACVGARVLAVSTSNASPWLNQTLLADSLGYVGVGYMTTSNIIGGFNYDVNSDTATQSMTPPSTFVLQQRHDGGNLVLSLNGGSEASAASGNTTSTIGDTRIFSSNGSLSVSANLYGLIIRSTAFTATERANVLAYVNNLTKAY